MKPGHYIKKVKDSDSYKAFMKEDPKAFLCSVFFTRDFVGKQDETQVDFYSPKTKTIVSFKAGGKVERAPIGKKAETLTHKKLIPKPLTENLKMDIDAIEPVLVDEMHNRGMTYEIEKVLAFVSLVDGEPIWNCTAFLKGLGLLLTHVEDKSQSVLFMEKKSFFDILRFTGPKPGMQTGTQSGLGQGSGMQVQPQVLTVTDDEEMPVPAAKPEKQKQVTKPTKDSEKKQASGKKN